MGRKGAERLPSAVGAAFLPPSLHCLLYFLFFLLLEISLEKLSTVFLPEKKCLWAWVTLGALSGSKPHRPASHPGGGRRSPSGENPHGHPLRLLKCLQRSGFLLSAAALSGMLVPDVTSAGHSVSWATPRRPLSYIAWHPCHPACRGRVTRAASALNQAIPLGLTSFTVMPGAHSGWPRATKPWLLLPEAKPGTSKAGWELEASRGPCGVWTQPASAGGMWGGVTTGPQTESETPDVEGAPLLQHQCPRGPESPIRGEALGFRERPGRGDAVHRTSRKK